MVKIKKDKFLKIVMIALVLLLLGCGKSVNNPVSTGAQDFSQKKFVSPGCFVLGGIEWCGDIDMKFLQDLMKKNYGFVDYHSLYFAYLAVGQDKDLLKDAAETAKKVGVKLLKLLDYTEASDSNAYHLAAAQLKIEDRASQDPSTKIGVHLACKYDGVYKEVYTCGNTTSNSTEEPLSG